MNRQNLPSRGRFGNRMGWTLASGILGAAALWGCSKTKTPGTASEARVAAAQEQTTLVEAQAAQSTSPAVAAAPDSATVPAVGTVSKNAFFEDAESAFRGKRYGEAVDLFTAYVERKPNNAWGHYMLGLSAWKAGQHEKAERAFAQALKLDPRHVKSLLNWSRVLLETDRPDEALAKIETALGIDPESKDAHRLLGRARAELGQVEGAVEAYQHAIALDERDAWSMNNLGLLYINVGRFAEALPPLARATELRNDVPTFQNNLGVALEHTGHVTAAAAAYRAALSQDPGYEKASLSLARVGTLTEDPALAPVDLAVLAQEFAAEVPAWHQEISGRATASPRQDDSSGAALPVASRHRQPAPPEEPN